MKKILLCMGASLLLFACGGAEVAPEKGLPEIYEDAYGQLDKQNYARAAEAFQEAERRFPSSEWAADALSKAAYAAYMDQDFAGALMITDRFMRFHPGHRDVAYVLYLRGMCYYRQVSDVRREPGMSVYALQSFQQLVQRFPRTEYAKNAENKILILKNYIAGKAMYSARRDMQKQNWTAAVEQLQQIVSTAQETVMTPEAMFRLTECYAALGLPEQAAGYAGMLRANFPENEWTKKLEDSKAGN